MLDKLTQPWKQLKHSRPGHRFQERYHRRQRQTGGRLSGSKLLNIVAGLAVAALGVFLVPAPGPGFAVLALGLGLIGGEFWPVALFLDAVEVRARAVLKRALDFWRFASPSVRAGAVVLLLLALAAVSYAAYLLFFR